MNKGFSHLSVIALIVIAVMAIYSFLIPKFDYASLFQEPSDSLLVVDEESYADEDSLEIITPEVEKKKPKKKYVKKIKPVAFSEIVGGDDFSPLEPFFAKLDSYGKHDLKRLRIAYYGDSITESDLGTGKLRKIWQDSLGGKGVGFVAAVSDLSQFRASIKHTYSDNWTEYSISKISNRAKPLGLFGNVAVPSLPQADTSAVNGVSLSWHTYSMMEGNWLANPTLIILNNKSPLTIEYQTDRDTLIKEIKVSEEVQFISLSDSLLKYLSISYFPQDTTYVYGVDFANKEGIYIDNYSLRGNKGNNFIHLQDNILNQMNNYFKYDLTILHYGANVTDPVMIDYSWYRISMKKNINYLKTIDYGQPMILFSVGDRGAQLDTLWVSSPDLPYLIKEQQRIAKDTEIGFFNLFTALGGENCNVDLHTQGYLTPDHTHFTRKGAKYFGELLYGKFRDEYEKYQENN